MEETSYGLKKEGRSQFIIIAPHAAGDDLKTGLVAEKLAEELDGFLVINQVYKKPSNSSSTDDPDKREDFNDLCWGHSYDKYLWKPKQPDMKLFFKDIKEFSNQARKYSPEEKAVAIYIHGMDSADTAIDIGAGAKRTFGNGSILGTKVLNAKKNKGKITLKISQIKKMKQLLSPLFKEKYNMGVTIGKRHTGWSKQSAIQFHKHEGRDDYAVQFEISHRFRLNKEKRDYLINCLTSTLKEIFKQTT